MKAEEQRFKIKDLSGDLLSTENFDKEMKNMKLKVRHPSTLARAEHQLQVNQTRLSQMPQNIDNRP